MLNYFDIKTSDPSNKRAKKTVGAAPLFLHRPCFSFLRRRSRFPGRIRLPIMMRHDPDSLNWTGRRKAGPADSPRWDAMRPLPCAG